MVRERIHERGFMKEGEDPMLQDEAANENVGGEVDMAGDRHNTCTGRRGRR